MSTGTALADVRCAEYRLSDALLDRRRVVRTWLWRVVVASVPLIMLGFGVQAAILDSVDPGLDTRGTYGIFLCLFGLLGSALAMLWIHEHRGSLREQNDTVRARRREVRDARDVLAVARETAAAAGLSDAEDIVARWSPPTDRSGT